MLAAWMRLPGAHGRAGVAVLTVLRFMVAVLAPAISAGSRRRRARTAMAGAVLGLLAVPAGSMAAVTAPHVVVPGYNTSSLELDGYSPGASLTAEVVRNGVTIGTTHGVANNVGTMTVNPDVCWDANTPEILPGDTVRVSGDGDVDTTVVQNVTAGRPALVGSNIVVHGTASDPAGNPLPVAELESRLQAAGGKFSFGKKNLSAMGDGTSLGGPQSASLRYDAPGSTAWTAIFSGLNASDQQIALDALSRGIRSNAAASEVTIFDNPGAPGPAAPCTAPLVRNAATSSSPNIVNGSFAAVGGSLVISGVAQSDASAVRVSLDDEDPNTAPATLDATLSGGAGAQTWRVAFPAASVLALTDGTLTASADYTIASGTIAGTPLSVLKDTIAPAAPVASPGGGLFNADQSVALSAEPNAVIHLTRDGSPVTQLSPAYSGPLAVDGSQTISALAVDQAGNVWYTDLTGWLGKLAAAHAARTSGLELWRLFAWPQG
jgi:hypothetical protein